MSTTITAAQVQELRDQTGLGMMQVKNALVDAEGDTAKALTLLKERGLASTAKRADRQTHEGTVGTYLHSNKKLLAAVTLLCETDFVARGDGFQEVAHQLAMHVAAANPTYVKREDVPADIIAAETAVLEKQLENEGKPKELWAKILPGKLEKIYADSCLLEQQYALDPEQKVSDLVTTLAAKVGEKVTVGAIHRITL